MTIQIKGGSTSRSIDVALHDATTGLGYASGVYSDAGISLWYRRGTTGAVTAITPATQTVGGAYSSGGFVNLSTGDNLYRLDLPDAALAAGVDSVTIGGHATAWTMIAPTIQITGYDPRTDAVATVAGSLDTNAKQWAGTAVATPTTAGVPRVDVKAMEASVLTAAAIATDAITAAKIAADAIGASELAADAVAEIQSGLATSSALTTAQADLTTLVGRITGAVALATSTTAAAIRSALGMAAATMDTNVPGVLQTKAQADTDQTAVLTAIGLRLLTSAYTAPPSVGAIADQVWDEILSGHVIAGSTGAAMTASGFAADPMTNDPADYTSGQLGYLIGRLAGGRITVRGMVTPSGDMDEIVGGADYSATDGYSFDWTDAENELAWPALTGASVSWVGRSPDGQETTLAMTVVTPTGDKVVRLAMTAAQTAALVAMQTGIWTFTVKATLLSGRVRPLVVGKASVVDLVGL